MRSPNARWGLSSSLAIGVALVSCMPGGTASNIVAYIAKGDMPLSVMMTTASTLMAVVTTPLLTSLLVVGRRGGRPRGGGGRALGARGALRGGPCALWEPRYASQGTEKNTCRNAWNCSQIR